MFKNITNFCGDTHTIVHGISKKLFIELKRTYYVTPTIFIDLVTGYHSLLAQKQHEFGHDIEKLR